MVMVHPRELLQVGCALIWKAQRAYIITNVLSLFENPTTSTNTFTLFVYLESENLKGLEDESCCVMSPLSRSL